MALEALSRGAKTAYLCDNSFKATKVIKQNIEKTKMQEKTKLINKDFLTALELIKLEEIKFDIIFLDPPYKTNYVIQAIESILKNDLITESGKIIIETDIEDEVLEKLQDFSLDVLDVKKYGRVTLIFVRRKG